MLLGPRLPKSFLRSLEQSTGATLINALSAAPAADSAPLVRTLPLRPLQIIEFVLVAGVGFSLPCGSVGLWVCGGQLWPDVCRPEHQLIAAHLGRLPPGVIFSDCGVGRATGSARHAMFFLARLRDDGYIDAVAGTDRLYRNVRVPESVYDRLRPILRLPSAIPTPVDVTRLKRPLRPPASRNRKMTGKLVATAKGHGKRRRKGLAAKLRIR